MQERRRTKKGNHGEGRVRGVQLPPVRKTFEEGLRFIKRGGGKNPRCQKKSTSRGEKVIV